MPQIFDVWNFIVRIKACVLYSCFCHQNKTLKKWSKMILLYPKSSLYPQDFHFFFYFSLPLFSILGHGWFYRRSWLVICSKVYDIIMSLNWIKKKTESLIPGAVNFWPWYLLMNKFACSKADFGPLHWQGDSFAYSMLITSNFILYDPKVTESLEMRLGFKTWPIIYLGCEPKTFWSWVEGIKGSPGSKPVSGSKVDSVFIFSRLMKWVLGTSGDLKVRSELPPRSGSVSLRQNPIHKKGS